MWKFIKAKIKRFSVKIMSFFIFSSQARKDFRAKFLLDLYEMPYIHSKNYGKIYMPYYSNFQCISDTPELYNKEGRKMDIFFIRDRMSSQYPYGGSTIECSKYFLWDKYNIDLDIHFYTHGSILETMGNPKEKYAFFYESELIVPKEYELFKKHKGIEKEFNAVFTYSEDLLETLDNAKFFPACATMWYGKEYFKGVKDPTELNPKVFETKNKNISMICSAKKGTELHKFRHFVAEEALKTGTTDVFGGFKNGQRFDYKSKTLKDYRYQIVVENDIKPYYFTEKIIDCFASMTIPIYLGATKIDSFFNPDGIIKITKESDIAKVLKSCTDKEYNNRLEAIKENYEKCLKYRNINDLLYEEFFLNKKI